MIIKVKGVVIKQRPIGERDAIITILSDELGIIEASARGVKSLKSKIQSGIQLMCFSDFILFKGKSTYIVNSAESIEQFYNIRLDVEKVSLASYFFEVINFVSMSMHTANETIRLLLNTLFLLSENKHTNEFIKIVFEFKLMCISGFQPLLESCAQCGEDDIKKGVILLSDGIILCENCSDTPCTAKAEFNSGVIKTLRFIADAQISRVFGFNIDDKTLEYVSKITEYYLLYHCDRTFKSLDFYRNISKEFL